MTPQLNDKLRDRVEHEKSAHTEDDILKKNIELKGLFPHLSVSPTMQRLEKDFHLYLENVKGLRILDLGCGYGEQSLDLLQRGASVSGIDISQKYIDHTIKEAHKFNFSKSSYDFRVMDAHALDFSDAIFNLVVGRGILHHLDLKVVMGEIHRVLKTGGKALFLEPLAANPFLKLFRVLTPHARTKDERPLSPEDIRDIENSDWHVQNKYYGLISAPVAIFSSVFLRPFADNFLLHLADSIECRVNLIKTLEPLNQYVLLNLIRK
ncbi:MAG: class I SAM-dependent methyltransferase [Desulfobacteraceae bacterium]|nr:class I SAM-dependent methyltransferase [Desulfobacteraceae bacterium]MBU3947844.1 class I SAM-dependent methyltransferase [Pseudomonadota bacterium]